MKKVAAKFGVGSQLEKWLDITYQEKVATVMMEGQGSEKIKSHKELRQGCPLSPLIYNLGLEPLAIAIKAIRAINGVQFQGLELKLSLHADDVLCYLGNPLQSLSSLQTLIGEFWHDIGL